MCFLNQEKTIQLICKIQEGKFTSVSHAGFLFNLHLAKRSSFEFILDSTTACGRKQHERSSSRIHNAPASPHWVAMPSSGHSLSYLFRLNTLFLIPLCFIIARILQNRWNEIILIGTPGNEASQPAEGSQAVQPLTRSQTSSLPLQFSLPGKAHIMKNSGTVKTF